MLWVAKETARCPDAVEVSKLRSGGRRASGRVALTVVPGTISGRLCAVPTGGHGAPGTSPTFARVHKPPKAPVGSASPQAGRVRGRDQSDRVVDNRRECCRWMDPFIAGGNRNDTVVSDLEVPGRACPADGPLECVDRRFFNRATGSAGLEKAVNCDSKEYGLYMEGPAIWHSFGTEVSPARRRGALQPGEELGRILECVHPSGASEDRRIHEVQRDPVETIP